jgi:drug/metabolite transporter (DMT)-like permease
VSVALAGLVFAVLGSLAWAGLDVLRKQVGQEVSATAAVAALTLFQVPLLAAAMTIGEAVGPSAEPWSVVLNGFPTLTAPYAWPLLGSVLLNVVANWLFLRAVQISPLSLTIPYLSFTPVFTAFSGLVMLGEVPTMGGWVGIVLVVAGAFFLNPGESGEGPLAPLRALWGERGSLYMLGVAALWSITPVFDKVGAEMTNVMGHTALVAAGLFVAFYLLRLVRDRDPLAMIGEFGRAPKLLFLGAVVNVFAMVFQLGAYHWMDVAYMETLKRAIGVIASILVGWWWFEEADVKRRLLGAVVMAIGVGVVLLLG